MFKYWNISSLVITSLTLYYDIIVTRSRYLESPGNLLGPISDFGDKCSLAEVNF